MKLVFLPPMSFAWYLSVKSAMICHKWIAHLQRNNTVLIVSYGTMVFCISTPISQPTAATCVSGSKKSIHQSSILFLCKVADQFVANHVAQ